MNYVATIVATFALGLTACGGSDQAEACANMIDCDVALGAADIGWTTFYEQDNEPYGETGSCWVEADTDDTTETTETAEGSEACILVCEVAIEAYIAKAQEYVDSGDLSAVPASCALPEEEE